MTACFFALKKSEQAKIVAFNRLVVNVLTVVTQERKYGMENE